jgi:hypothetical protein
VFTKNFNEDTVAFFEKFDLKPAEAQQVINRHYGLVKEDAKANEVLKNPVVHKIFGNLIQEKPKQVGKPEEEEPEPSSLADNVEQRDKDPYEW